MFISKYVSSEILAKTSGEDMHETVEVLCHATATCVEGGIGVKGAVSFRKIGFGGDWWMVAVMVATYLAHPLRLLKMEVCIEPLWF